MSRRSCLLILARIILDDLLFADGTRKTAIPGGAGLHAAAGAALWWPDVAPVAGVGGDIHEVTHGLLRALSDAGLAIRGPHTVRSRLVYRAGGGRTETPIFGQTHFDDMQTTVSDIPRNLLSAAGLYVFRDADASFWADIEAMRPALGALLWELDECAATASQWPSIAPLLPLADIFSINLAEATGLFGASSPQTMLDRLLDGGCRTALLRMGAEGALAATRQERLHVRPPPVAVIDETGCGNSFCGGFLASWCDRPGELDLALRRGAGSAACTIQQVGPARFTRDAAVAFAAESVVRAICVEASA